MQAQRYPEEFRIEAVKQVVEHGHAVADVSRRLGVSTHSLYKSIKQQKIPAAQRLEQVLNPRSYVISVERHTSPVMGNRIPDVSENVEVVILRIRDEAKGESSFTACRERT